MKDSIEFMNDCRRSIKRMLAFFAGRSAAVIPYHGVDNPRASELANIVASCCAMGELGYTVRHLPRTARLAINEPMVLITLLVNDHGLNTVYDQDLPAGVIDDRYAQIGDRMQLVVNVEYTCVAEAVTAFRTVCTDVIVHKHTTP